jgi:hypothetical protein
LTLHELDVMSTCRILNINAWTMSSYEGRIFGASSLTAKLASMREAHAEKVI